MNSTLKQHQRESYIAADPADEDARGAMALVGMIFTALSGVFTVGGIWLLIVLWGRAHGIR